MGLLFPGRPQIDPNNFEKEGPSITGAIATHLK